MVSIGDAAGERLEVGLEEVFAATDQVYILGAESGEEI